MGKLNKYKELVGLPKKEKILRQIEISKKFSKVDGKFGKRKRKTSKADDLEKSNLDSNKKGNFMKSKSSKEENVLNSSKKQLDDASKKKKMKAISSISSNSERNAAPLESKNKRTLDSFDREENSMKSPTKKAKIDFMSKIEDKLKGARFRFINEILYTTTGAEANEMFANDPQLFDAYHDGYQQQKDKWPFDPLENIIQQIGRMNKKFVIADMGCGDARLASSVDQKVHSFDLVAKNDKVVAADIANVPLPSESVDVCIFCLSLMGTNLADYICEANRILKKGGSMKIVEIRSRFESVGAFKRALQRLGFELVKHVKLPDDYFIRMDFQKASPAKKNSAVNIQLKPCVYKKR